MDKPIRVAHVMGKMVGGGLEQVVMNYYRHIDRSRVQFDLIVDSDSTLVPLDEVESLGGRVFTVPPYQHVLAYQRALVRLFREQDWRIVHSHENSLSVFPLRAAKRAGVPVRIAHSHSTAGGRDFARNAMKAVLRSLANIYPTHRAACTRHAGEWLFSKGAEFKVIPNAIDLDEFRFDASRRSRMRKLLGLDDGQLAVGHVGRFTPQKNQPFLIRVFAQVVKERPSARLFLVGEGCQRQECETLAASICPKGSVVFLGQRSDMADLYCAFDVFCLPSEFEGLGMVAVEAEVAGLPCILSNGVPHDADPAGNAIFFPTNDENACFQAIISINSKRRQDLAHSLFQNFDIKLNAPQLVEWYEVLVANIPMQGAL